MTRRNICNATIQSPSPRGGSCRRRQRGGMSRAAKGADCKSAGYAFVFPILDIRRKMTTRGSGHDTQEYMQCDDSEPFAGTAMAGASRRHLPSNVEDWKPHEDGSGEPATDRGLTITGLD
jgi:hypothetical protein